MDHEARMLFNKHMNIQSQSILIEDYYDKKCLTEGEEAALNMTLKRFWFNQELLGHLMTHIQFKEMPKSPIFMSHEREKVWEGDGFNDLH